MTDHERYLVLASQELESGLPPGASAELGQHLASCPSCRTLAAGMRRDQARLRAILGEAPVAPSVRARVLEEAAGRRSGARRLTFGLVAALVLVALAVPAFIVGGLPWPDATAGPAASPLPASPSPSAPGTPTLGPSASPAATPPPAARATLSGVYTYVVFGGAGRGVSVQAQERGSEVVGAWSVWSVDQAGQQTEGGMTSGTVTCLVVRDRDAFAFGPADDGGPSVFIWVHDGVEPGSDRAMTWLQDPGQPDAELEGWCRNAGAGYEQRQPVPLTSGSLIVESATPGPTSGPTFGPTSGPTGGPP